MAGLDPAIHVLLGQDLREDVDARVKPGHDDLDRGVSDQTATSSATPITISAIPKSSRTDSGCLNE
jgi:hypothetical protein